MSARPASPTVSEWLDRHTAQAPAALRARVLQHVAAMPNAQTAAAPAAVLAEAGRAALDLVIAHPGDRSAALDLLAADALVTLALLAQAEAAPERLGAFAASLLADRIEAA